VDLTIERVLLIGKIAKVLTYVGILFTTSLSVYTLRLETVIKAPNPLEPNRFTPAGKKYLWLLIASSLFTIGVSILQNWSDSRIADDSQRRLREGLAGELKKQTGDLLGTFNKQLNDETNSLTLKLDTLARGIDATTTNLSETRREVGGSGKELTRLLSQTSRDLSLGEMKVLNFFIEVRLRRSTARARVSSKLPSSGFAKVECTQGDVGNNQDACDLFNHLDPNHHFVISLIVTLKTFSASVHTRPEPVRTISTFLNKTTAIPYQTEEVWLREGATADFWGFSFDWGDSPLLKSSNLWSRDTDLSNFSVHVCDANSNHESSTLVAAHLSRFPVSKTWQIRIVPFDENHKPFPKQYVATLNQRNLDNGDDNCVSWEYEPY